ncbi:MAG TPA: type II secretion system protein GspM [Xanthomonadaceae bacterium]|nr:type II secretion system protein GspM [Xanthomonadaceae bacterium]
MARPADRDRWLAMALLIAALGLAYLLLVHPWWTGPMVQVQDRIDLLRERELRVRMRLQQAPDVQRLLAQARARQAGTSGFLPEATAELATAGLVQRLETVVAQASPGNVSCAILNRTPINRAPADDGYVPVAVQVNLQCGTPELAQVLHALEGGAPRLFVDNFNVLPIRRYVLGADRAQGNGGLNVSFELVGYLRPAPAPAAVASTGGGRDAD